MTWNGVSASRLRMYCLRWQSFFNSLLTFSLHSMKMIESSSLQATNYTKTNSRLVPSYLSIHAAYWRLSMLKSPFRLLRSKGHNYAGEKGSRCCLPEKGCRNLRVPILLFQKSLKSAYLYPWPLYFRLRICICDVGKKQKKATDKADL